MLLPIMHVLVVVWCSSSPLLPSKPGDAGVLSVSVLATALQSSFSLPSSLEAFPFRPFVFLHPAGSSVKRGSSRESPSFFVEVLVMLTRQRSTNTVYITVSADYSRISAARNGLNRACSPISSGDSLSL